MSESTLTSDMSLTDIIRAIKVTLREVVISSITVVESVYSYSVYPMKVGLKPKLNGLLTSIRLTLIEPDTPIEDDNEFTTIC